jgi:hypothetical protein
VVGLAAILLAAPLAETVVAAVGVAVMAQLLVGRRHRQGKATMAGLVISLA